MSVLIVNSQNAFAIPGDLLWQTDLAIPLRNQNSTLPQTFGNTQEGVAVQVTLDEAPGSTGSPATFRMFTSAGTQGGDTGFLQMDMNAQDDDENFCLEVQITFDADPVTPGLQGVRGLEVNLSDMDQAGGFRDLVLVRGLSGGAVVGGTASLPTGSFRTTIESGVGGGGCLEGGADPDQGVRARVGAGVGEGDCFQGTGGGAGSRTTQANGRVTFADSQSVDTIIIDYCPSEANGENPGFQLIGLGDLFWFTPPIAIDDFEEGNFNAPVTISPLTNDESVGGGTSTFDPDNATNPMIFTTAGQPPGAVISGGGTTIMVPGEGTYVINQTTGDVTFTPVTGFAGQAMPVTYSIFDTTAGEAVTAMINISIEVDFGDAPDTYGTTFGNGGPAHEISNPVNLAIGTASEPDGDGQPDGSAGSDIDNGGPVFPPATTVFNTGDTYTVTVDTFNNTGLPATICGWVDLDFNNMFDNPAERACAPVVQGQTSATLNFTVPDTTGLDGNNNINSFSRFRIASDAAEVQTPGGAAASGEVEDHPLVVSVTPVTLAHFESQSIGDRIRFKWSTSSETFNFGFNLWGDVEGDWYRLNKSVVPSKGMDSLVTNSYKARVSTTGLPGEVSRVGISSVEINGHEEFYGPYAIGESVGEEVNLEVIDWDVIAAEAILHMTELGYVQRGRHFVKERKAGRLSAASLSNADLAANQALTGNNVLAEFRSGDAGVHRVSHAHLLAANVDLSGITIGDLALTHNGNAQVRFIHGNNGIWDNSSYIDYYSTGVSDEMLLHTNENVFRLEHDASRVHVLAAGEIDRDVQNASATHTATVTRNEQVTYDFAMPKPDPWYERYLFLTPTTEGSAGTIHTFTLDAGHVDAAANDALVTARVITLTDFGSGMDHRVELVHVNSTGVENVIDIRESDGYATMELSAPLAASELSDSSQFLIKQKLIDPDPNTGQLPAHWFGSALYFDSASVSYTATNQAQDDLVHWNSDSDGGDGYSISNLTAHTVTAYAHANGSLVRLQSDNLNQDSATNTWSADVPAVAQGDATYWVSTDDALLKPVVTTVSLDAQALATGSSDYLIIAHPGFLDRLTNPDTAYGEIDFVANKESHGHTVTVVDYEQVAQIYGHGHRTPEAITSYLTAESQVNANLTYVLLVGNASRDPNNHTGNGSWNLIPVYYDKTYSVLHYAPNDGRLADVDGDGYQDLAIGRWPARTETELNTFINKTIAYTDGSDATPATQSLNTAVLAADLKDIDNFAKQMDSVDVQLTQAGFTTTKVYKDTGATSQDLINAINAGQSFTSYSGHAGPSQWSYQGMLHYSQINQLTNADHPTLMLPLSCYTTYTVSEHTDTLGQKLMSHTGGAVAIMGAASLSSYAENQAVITDIMQSMISGVDIDADGNPDITLTLGEAVARAKQTMTRADSAVNISGNLIGDPSIRISAQNQTSNMATRALRVF